MLEAAHADLVSPSASLRALVPDKIHPSAADARGNGADNSANGGGDVVVGARRMGDAVAAGARDPPLQSDDLGDEPINAAQGDGARAEQPQQVPKQSRR